jgi:hypothetical protein
VEMGDTVDAASAACDARFARTSAAAWDTLRQSTKHLSSSRRGSRAEFVATVATAVWVFFAGSGTRATSDSGPRSIHQRCHRAAQR